MASRKSSPSTLRVIDFLSAMKRHVSPSAAPMAFINAPASSGVAQNFLDVSVCTAESQRVDYGCLNLRVWVRLGEGRRQI